MVYHLQTWLYVLKGAVDEIYIDTGFNRGYEKKKMFTMVTDGYDCWPWSIVCWVMVTPVKKHG